MGNSSSITLADRLTEIADAIENPSMHDAEMTIREAAAVIREIGTPTPTVVRLISELRKAALFADTETKTTLRTMLGEYAG